MNIRGCGRYGSLRFQRRASNPNHLGRPNENFYANRKRDGIFRECDVVYEQGEGEPDPLLGTVGTMLSLRAGSLSSGIEGHAR